jgi:UDPglucose--hexose-1-phosphate uridylyltransferase
MKRFTLKQSWTSNSAHKRSHMSEFRYDWFSDRWVIFAPQRSHRPDEFANQWESLLPGSDCPFCTGNESETPVPVLMLPTLEPNRTPTTEASRRERNCEATERKTGRGNRRTVNTIPTPSWKVRVVPNKYPALKPLPDDLHVAGLSPQLSFMSATALEVPALDIPAPSPTSNASKNSDRASAPPCEENCLSMGYKSHCDFVDCSKELFQSGNFHGSHEVFVECGEHKTSLTQLPLDHVQLVLQSYAERLRYWRTLNGFQYGVVFKNSGAAAGATLSHLHSQLMVTSFLPTEIQRLVERWQSYSQKYAICPVCNLIEREIADGSRLVWESDHFVAICPYASRSPYFVSIFPKKHAPQFEMEMDEHRAELASYLLRTIKGLENALTGASYNYVIHTAPFGLLEPNGFHWRIDLFPRLGKFAGFEWASGSQINAILPEEAARTLRLYFATSSLP